MGVVRPGREFDREEQEPGGSGLHLDLDLVACPSCRRELPGFVELCPDCDVPPVPRSQLPGVLPPPPAHLLADDDADDANDANDADDAN